ncbi:hypothetical protein ACFQ2B_21405 [Streptomyces stramineus]
MLLGTLLWDVCGQRRLVPWWSWIALILLYGSVFAVPDESARGLIRLAFVAVSTAYVLLWPMHERGSRRHRPLPGRSRRRGLWRGRGGPCGTRAAPGRGRHRRPGGEP